MKIVIVPRLYIRFCKEEITKQCYSKGLSSYKPNHHKSFIPKRSLESLTDFVRLLNPKRSIDRGVVLLSKIKSFPTTFVRLCGILADEIRQGIY